MNSHMDRKRVVFLIMTEKYMFYIRSYLLFTAFYQKIYNFYKFKKKRRMIYEPYLQYMKNEKFDFLFFFQT